MTLNENLFFKCRFPSFYFLKFVTRKLKNIYFQSLKVLLLVLSHAGLCSCRLNTRVHFHCHHLNRQDMLTFKMVDGQQCSYWQKKKKDTLSRSQLSLSATNLHWKPFLSSPPCCSCSCCRLLTLNGCVLPSQESRPAARSTAGRRLSPGLPSVRQHAHTSAAKRRLSYDYNRNVVEWKEWSSGQRPVPQRPTDISGHVCAWRLRRDEKRGGVNSHSTSPLVFRWTQHHVLLFIQFPSRVANCSRFHVAALNPEVILLPGCSHRIRLIV